MRDSWVRPAMPGKNPTQIYTSGGQWKVKRLELHRDNQSWYARAWGKISFCPGAPPVTATTPASCREIENVIKSWPDSGRDHQSYRNHLSWSAIIIIISQTETGTAKTTQTEQINRNIFYILQRQWLAVCCDEALQQDMTKTSLPCQHWLEKVQTKVWHRSELCK